MSQFRYVQKVSHSVICLAFCFAYHNNNNNNNNNNNKNNLDAQRREQGNSPTVKIVPPPSFLHAYISSTANQKYLPLSQHPSLAPPTTPHTPLSLPAPPQLPDKSPFITPPPLPPPSRLQQVPRRRSGHEEQRTPPRTLTRTDPPRPPPCRRRARVHGNCSFSALSAHLSIKHDGAAQKWRWLSRRLAG